MRMIDRRIDFDFAAPSTFGPSDLTRIRMATVRMARRWRHRSAVIRLHEMSDYQLLDIGLRREDVRSALTSSYFADACLHLTSAARERANRHLRSGRLD